MKEDNISFEKAFERLEEILDCMNEGKISLDSSLKLFEEADGLIKKCQSNLSGAEQKIETLIKKRDQLVVENDQPQTEDFSPDNTQILR